MRTIQATSTIISTSIEKTRKAFRKISNPRCEKAKPTDRVLELKPVTIKSSGESILELVPADILTIIGRDYVDVVSEIMIRLTCKRLYTLSPLRREKGLLSRCV